MQRRDLIKGIVALSAAFICEARAQDPDRTYRLGQLFLSPRNAPQNIALYDALKSEGFVVGQNLLIDPQGFGLRVDELAKRALLIVEGEINVLVCGGEPAVRAA